MAFNFNTVPSLTIFLSRQETGGYTVDLHFDQPDSSSGIASARGPVVFDFARLRGASLDPQAYGRQLAATLFDDPRIKSEFEKAWVAAQQAGQEAGRLRLILEIDSGASEQRLRGLHSLRWETLCHPESGDFLFSDANLPFSRFLASPDWTKITLRPRGELRALVAVANPAELQGGIRLWDQILAPIKVDVELGRARSGLKGIGQIDELASSTDHTGQVTMENLLDQLRQGYDVLYLVCHGALQPEDSVKPEGARQTILVLEQPDGRVDRVDGDWLVKKIQELNAHKRPRLVVLASCQSGGLGQVLDPEKSQSNDRGALAALGPRLAMAGVPAVVAMQDNITMKTVEMFMPVFFQELARDGQIEQAMALARAVCGGRGTIGGCQYCIPG